MNVTFRLRHGLRIKHTRLKRLFRPITTECNQYHLPVYYPQENVENLEAYRPGGYHPVVLGDKYSQNRYRILHKLGYGSCSTVWLARDCIENRNVSIKFLTANASKSSKEVQMLGRVSQNSPLDPDHSFVSPLLNEFTITGPNGQHKCLISSILGPNLSDLKQTFVCDLLPLHIARRATAQLASALAQIHSCGMIHGDIHLKNLAWKSQDIDSWSIHRVIESLGPAITEAVSRLDGEPSGSEAPPYVVVPLNLRTVGGLYQGRLSILDFGEASFTTEPRPRWNTPMTSQAPEALLGESAGQPADIWAFACAVFELFNNEQLFEMYMPNADDILFAIVDTLGRLPDHWWAKWEFRWEFYEEDGTKKLEGLSEEYRENRTLAVRLRRMRSSPLLEQLSKEDVKGLQKLLERCFRYDPKERITARQILDLDWIKKLKQNY